MELTSSIKEYIYNFEPPAELDFFSDKQKAEFERENAKLKKTQDYLKAIDSNPKLAGQMEKDMATGAIYSQGEINKVLARNRALKDGVGDRTMPKKSLVSPTGQRIIISNFLAEKMGFLTDGYVLEDEINDLANTLKAEGVMEDKISKVKEAMQNYHAVILQRGAFEALFDLLSDLADYDAAKIKPAFESRGVSLDQLKSMAIVKSAAVAKLAAEKPKVPVIKEQAKPIVNLRSIADVKTLEDLKNIQVAHLRQGDLAAQVALIKNKIASIAQSNKILPYYAVLAFEESPLFQTYLMIGASMIFDENPDRVAAYKEAIRNSLDTGGDVLELNEFEAIADLRKQIEQH